MTYQACQMRLARLDAVVLAQRHYLGFVPDPDTRQRAEMHLFRLIEMRDEAEAACGRMRSDLSVT